jgi:hypothetical protein
MEVIANRAQQQFSQFFSKSKSTASPTESTATPEFTAPKMNKREIKGIRK